jgi:hypothetical protein
MDEKPPQYPHPDIQIYPDAIDAAEVGGVTHGDIVAMPLGNVMLIENPGSAQANKELLPLAQTGEDKVYPAIYHPDLLINGKIARDVQNNSDKTMEDVKASSEKHWAAAQRRAAEDMAHIRRQAAGPGPGFRFRNDDFV